MNDDSHDPLKIFDYTLKLTDRAKQEIDRFSKVFVKAECNEGCYAIFRDNDIAQRFLTISEHWSNTEFALRAGGYKDIVPVFQLALTLPLENACCERVFPIMNDTKTAKRNKLDNSLFALMLLAMYGKTHNFDSAKFGVL